MVFEYGSRGDVSEITVSSTARWLSGSTRVMGETVQRKGELDNCIAALQQCMQVPAATCLAPDKTVVLLHPPSPFSRCSNRDGEGMAVK